MSAVYEQMTTLFLSHHGTHRITPGLSSHTLIFFFFSRSPNFEKFSVHFTLIKKTEPVPNNMQMAVNQNI